MISLFAVVSPPRSGTKWYATLFSDQDVFCFHELTTLLHSWPARAIHDHAFDKEARGDGDDQCARRFFLDGYPTYFNRLLDEGQRGMRVVGNSDNTLVERAAGLWLLWPDTSFVFSTRNGINQVNSALVNELSLPALVASARGPEYAGITAFDAACRRWDDTIKRWATRRSWLEERGARCLSTTLEQVTTELDELERVWRFVAGDWERYAERAAALRASPVNEWVNLRGAIHTPEEIWSGWTSEQRARFSEICGEAQRSLGYDLPAQQV